MNEKEADVIACVRTIVFISYMTTNLVYLWQAFYATGTIDGFEAGLRRNRR
jgi:hypothetical protein